MDDAFLLENGTVIDGTGSAPFASAVLVEGNCIAALGKDALMRAQHLQHARRIDVSGMTVMPGLIDAHCHLSFDDAASNPEIFYLRRNALSALVAAYNAKSFCARGSPASSIPTRCSRTWSMYATRSRRGSPKVRGFPAVVTP